MLYKRHRIKEREREGERGRERERGSCRAVIKVVTFFAKLVRN